MRMGRQFWSLVLTGSSVLAAQTTPHPAGLAQMVVTNSCYYHDPPVLTADDLIVLQEYERRPITALIPLRGDRADLELYVLVANSSNTELGSSFADLREFLGSQPATTSIGIAYIQDGRLEVAQRPTRDRERAILALSPPSGSTPSNPFRPLADLIRDWSQGAPRRVVLLISDGIDPGATRGLINESVDNTLRVAQRAGVTVYALYHPDADYLSIDYMTVHAGQVQLAHFASETGGQAYFQGPGPLSSFAPYLANIADHLANQYLVEFATNPRTRGSLQDVSVASKIRDVHVLAPWKVWIPAAAIPQSDASAKRRVVAARKEADAINFSFREVKSYANSSRGPGVGSVLESLGREEPASRPTAQRPHSVFGLGCCRPHRSDRVLPALFVNIVDAAFAGASPWQTVFLNRVEL